VDFSIDEALLVMWSVIILPAVVVLLVAFFLGRLAVDEDRRYLAVREVEHDWWDQSAEGPAEGGAGS
jgi:hypothetical protein